MTNIERRNSVHPIRKNSDNVSVTLRVTGGPCSGNEYQLDEDEIIIGRQSDCNIVISDISVSRKHVCISRENGKYFLKDLGSGNGTYFNDELLAAEGIEIQNNFSFKIGDTELTFLLSSAHRLSRTNSRETRRSSGTDFDSRLKGGRSGRRKEESASASLRGKTRNAPKKSKLKIILIAIVCLFLFSILGKFAYEKKLDNQKVASEFAELKKQKDAIIDSMSVAVDKGRASTRKGDFKGAILHFQEAMKISEDNDLELPSDAKRNLEYAKKEVENQELIEQSQIIAKNGKLKEAVENINKISENSFYYNKISEIKDGFKEYFSTHMEKAKKLLEEKNFDDAQEAVEEILAVNPKEEDALKLQEEIERAAQLAKRPVKKVTVQAVEKEDVTAPILSVFYKGQLEAAIEQARACSDSECAKLVSRLEAFNAAFANVESDTEKAFSTLMTIPGAQKSSFYAAISSKIATTLTKDGIREMGNENYSAAFKAFQRVLSLDSGNNVAKKHMVTIRQHANELFQQGYVEKGMDPEAARRKFEKVITMTDAKDDLNQKAKRHLSQLSGGY